MIEPKLLTLLITLFFLGGAVWPFLPDRIEQSKGTLPTPIRVSLWLTLLGSTVAIGGAIPFLRQPTLAVTQSLWTSSWSSGLPPLTWEIHLDSLSAFFILLTAGFAAIVAIYSLGALNASYFREQARWIAAAFNLFVWSTLMVGLANDAFSLIVCLELMSLSFAWLTLYKHTLYLGNEHNLRLYSAAQQTLKQTNARLAPQVYLIVSHTSTAFLIIALLLFVIDQPSLSFDHLRASPLPGHNLRTTLIFLLVLAGLGIRAGLVPAHFWAPLSHPPSPTITHAFSLGIAIKISSIYLMYRCFFQFMDPETWWGYTVLLLAAFTALVNVWYAIASHDLKEALAYHSLENIGIMLAGIGVALIYAPTQTESGHWIATVALIASLYHLLNHAIFKGLLYLCIGAIEKLTNQTVELDRLGGLLKLFPWTASMFLVGAVAIAGFPPFNGFVSEWLTVQAIFAGIAAFHSFPAPNIVILILALLLLVAAFALTAFCFYKIVGLGLLGSPRATEEERARWATDEKRAIPWTMRGVMGTMALLCLLLGLFPAVVINGLLDGVAGTVLGHTQPLASSLWNGIALNTPLPTARPQFTPISLLALGLVLMMGVVWYKRRLNPQRPVARPATPWNCGTSYQSTQMQPTSAALSFLVRDRLDAAPDAVAWATKGTEYLPARLELSHSPIYPQAAIEVSRVIYNRLWGWLDNHATHLDNMIQNRDIRRYLSYIFLTTVVMLLLFLLWRGG